MRTRTVTRTHGTGASGAATGERPARSRWWGVGLVVVVAPVMGLASCAADGAERSPAGPGTPAAAPGGEYTAEMAEPTYLAPGSNCYESECTKILNMVNDPLVSTDAESGELVFDGLAESIEPNEDQTVWTVTLKEGRTWHNGEPVTAENFANAWNYSQDPKNAQATAGFMSRIQGAGEGKTMSGMKVVDDQTFEVTLNGPFSAFGAQMSYAPAFAPISDECLDDIKGCNEQPVGTGPYQMDGPWQHDEAITVTKWADYAGDQPAQADKVTFQMFTNPTAAYRDFQNGGLDVISLAPEVYLEAKDTLGDSIIEEPTADLTFLGFPTGQAPFDDPAVRQAISMSIDRRMIADQILNGRVYPATDIVPPPIPGSRDDACGYCVYDPEQARQLLADAGVDLEGETIQFALPADAGYDAWVEAAARQVQDNLGVDYELRASTFAQYIRTLSAGQVDGPFALGWTKDYASPENYLRPLLGTGGDANLGGYSSPGLDDLLVRGDEAGTPEEGIELYQQAGDVALEEMPLVPLWSGGTSIAHSDRVTTVGYDDVDAEISFKEITVVP